MEFNLFQLLYLGLRFTPFVIVSFLVGLVFFNRDVRVMIFLVGYIITCILAIQIGNVVGKLQSVLVTFDFKKETTCNAMNLTSNLPLSVFPLSLILYSYTLFYYLFIIVFTHSSSQGYQDNMTIMIFLVVIIFFEFFWLLIFCTFWWKLVASIVIGIIGSLLWCFFISKTRLAVYQYQTFTSGECEMISPNVYQCR